MQVFPAYFTRALFDCIAQWTDESDADPTNWRLKSGAPDDVVNAWPDYIRVMTTKDTLDPEDLGPDWVAPETRSPKP